MNLDEAKRFSEDLSRASSKFISHERRKKDTHSLIEYHSNFWEQRGSNEIKR